MNHVTTVAAATALILSGCTSRPREFAPQLASTSTATAGFEAAHAECRALLVAGKLDSNGRLASGAAGAAAGGALAVGGAAAAGGAGLYGGMAIASATVVLLPFVALGGAWGMAKIKRTKKEKAIQTALTGCLEDRGYDVNGWTRVKTKARKTPAAPPSGAQ